MDKYDPNSGYIERNGEIEQVWQIEYENRQLFKYKIFVRGTYSEMRKYIDSEMGVTGKHSACTKSEIRAINDLHIPIYIAPKLRSENFLER